MKFRMNMWELWTIYYVMTNVTNALLVHKSHQSQRINVGVKSKRKNPQKTYILQLELQIQYL
jgi:hypothetical protein